MSTTVRVDQPMMPKIDAADTQYVSPVRSFSLRLSMI
jgi:hypothetical protein